MIRHKDYGGRKEERDKGKIENLRTVINPEPS